MCFIIRSFYFTKKSNLIQAELRFFKKRFNAQTRVKNYFNILPYLYYNFVAIKIKKSVRAELIFFFFLKKQLKELKNSSYEKTFFFKKQIWICWPLNAPLTRKSKNARMGKGKGLFTRWTTTFKKFTIFLQFSSFVSIKKVCLLCIKLRKKHFLTSWVLV